MSYSDRDYRYTCGQFEKAISDFEIHDNDPISVATWVGTTILASGAGGAAAVGWIAIGAAGLAFVGTSLAITYGLSALSKALGMSPGMPNFNDDLGTRLTMSFESMPPKPFVYGRCRVSGPISYMDADQRAVGEDLNEMLWYEVVLAGHEIESFDEVYLNDTKAVLEQTANDAWPEGDVASLDADNLPRYRPTNTDYQLKMMLKLHHGAPTQTYDKDVHNGTNVGDTDGRNVTDHGRGIAYIAAAARMDKEAYSNGQPSISATIKGKNDIYDPRDSSTGYSDNPALCLANWLTTSEVEGGYGLTWAEIDEVALAVAATACDYEVPTYEGGPVSKRYICGGRFFATEEPATIIQNFLQCMHGSIERINGKIAIRAGVHRLPEITLTETDWVAPISIQTQTSITDTYNAIKPVLVSPNSEWEVSDVETVVGETPYDSLTLDSTANTITQPGTIPMVDGDMVRFDVWTGSAYNQSLIPANLSQDTYYFVVNADASTFQVSASSGGTPVDIGTLSSGTLVVFKDVYLSRDNGVRKVKGLTYPMVPEPITVRRLAFTQLKLDRNEIIVSGVCNLRAMNLAQNDTVRLIDSERGYLGLTGSSFTASIAADGTVTQAAHGHANNDPLYMSDSGSSGLRQAIVYYVADVTTDTYKLTRHPRVTTRTHPEEAGTLTLQTCIGKLFQVVSNSLSNDGQRLTCPLVLREANDDDYDWDGSYVTEPGVGEFVVFPSIRDVAPPTNFTLESGTDQLIKASDGTIVVRVRASWDPTGDAFVTIGGEFELQWKLNSETQDKWRSTIVDGSVTEHYFAPMPEEDINVRIRAINVADFKSDWALWSDGGSSVYTVIGKTAPPSNVSSLVVETYDPNRIRAKLRWTDPTDLDLWYNEVYFDVDTGSGYSGTLTYVGAALAGAEEFWVEGVYSQGTASDWKFVVKSVDTTKNVSEEPWPEVVSTINPISGVSGLSVAARAALDGGLQINFTWPDDSSGSKVAKQWWRKNVSGDERGAPIVRTAMSELGADIDIPLEKMNASGSQYTATEFWVKVWRVFFVDGQEVWSDADSVLVEVQPDLKAPARAANIQISYDYDKKQATVTWSNPPDPDYSHALIYRKKTTTSSPPSSWLGTDVIETVSTPGISYTEDNVWAEGGVNTYYHYRIVTVDKLTNANTSTQTGANLGYVLVNVDAQPTISTVQPLGGGGGFSVSWPANALFVESEMYLQWGKDGDEDTIDKKTVPYKRGHPTLAADRLGTAVFLPPGSAGNWWLRIWRVYKINGYDVFTAPYNHPSWIAVTEDTIAPATPNALTATYAEDDDVVVLEFETNDEIDLSHYNYWRRRLIAAPSTWSSWEKIGSQPASNDIKDNTSGSPSSTVRYEDPVPWQQGSSGTTYQYQVKAIDQAGNASATGSLSNNVAITNVNPPAAPTNVAYVFGPEGAIISWDQPWAKDYEYTYIERKMGVGGTWRAAGRAKGAAHVDSGGPTNIAGITGETREWYYRVKHTDKAGNQTAWVEATLSSGNRYRPAPTPAFVDIGASISAVQVSSGSVYFTVSWDEGFATAYEWARVVISDATNERYRETVAASYDAQFITPIMQVPSSGSETWTMKIYFADEFGNYSAADTDTVLVNYI